METDIEAVKARFQLLSDGNKKNVIRTVRGMIGLNFQSHSEKLRKLGENEDIDLKAEIEAFLGIIQDVFIEIYNNRLIAESNNFATLIGSINKIEEELLIEKDKRSNKQSYYKKMIKDLGSACKEELDRICQNFKDKQDTDDEILDFICPIFLSSIIRRFT